MVEVAEFAVSSCMDLLHTAFSAEHKLMVFLHAMDSELVVATASTLVVIVEGESSS